MKPLVRTVFYGTKSISHLGQIIWDMLTDTKKELGLKIGLKNRFLKIGFKNGYLRTALPVFVRHI